MRNVNVLAALPILVQAQGPAATPAGPQDSGQGDWYWHHMYDGWGHMMGWGGGIGIILFWGVIIILLILLARGLISRSGNRSRPSPLDLLRERYAKGEISKEEYEERKKTLAG